MDLHQILSGDVVSHALESVAMITAAFATWIFKRWTSTSFARTVSHDAIELAVEGVYHDYVKDMKAAAEDGKLTKDNIELANRKAIAAAAQIASEKGVDLLTAYSRRALELMVARAVARAKGQAAGVIAIQPSPASRAN